MTSRSRTSGKREAVNIDALVLERGMAHFCVLGQTPLLLHCMKLKAQQQLLLPARRKNRTERETTAKHDPYQEFQDAPDRLADPTAPTLLAFKAAGFKRAIASAALDVPGAKKTEVGRWITVPGDLIPIYGLPQLHMATVRNSDPGRTPDIRTRCIVPAWACELTVGYIKPNMEERVLAHLIAAAGLMIGIGDGRPEKGALNFGEFALVDPNDPTFLEIVQTGGRDAQEQAMKSPLPYNDETRELYSWAEEEKARRGFGGRGRRAAREAEPEG
jgi:hypothetical protein